MNVLFIDIDVLVDFSDKSNEKLFNESIEALKKVLDKDIDARIVLFSTSRNDSIVHLVEDAIHSKEKIVGCLQSWSDIRKVQDITDWFNKYKSFFGIGTFAIVTDGDESIRAMFPNNAISCKKDNGTFFDMKNADEAIWILSGFNREKNDIQHWLVSDTHFWHSNIIQYCNRPFKNAEEMNEELIKRWNAVVGSNDIVHHLGDFCFGKKENIASILPRLNGKIDLVLGNHDHHKIGFYYEAGFHRVYDKPIVLRNFYILSHAPLEWVSNNGVYANFYGHVHDSQVYNTVTARSCCVCVERWNYTPIRWEDAVEAMKKEEEKANAGQKQL